MGVLWKTLQPRIVGMVDGTSMFFVLQYPPGNLLHGYRSYGRMAMYGPLSSILLDYIPTIFNPMNNHWCSTAMEPGFIDEHQLEARMGAPSKNQAFSMNFKKKSG